MPANFTSEQVGEPSVGKLMNVEFVDHWFYSRDGLRAAGQLRDGGVMVSALASGAVQAAVISLALQLCG